MLIFPANSKLKLLIMRKSFRFLAASLIACLFSIVSFAQAITISGTVRNKSTNEVVPAVSIVVKGTSNGTYTNSDGGFTIKVTKLPVVLVFTAINFDTYESNVTDASAKINIDFVPNTTMGQEVAVAATRTPTRILESPVTIERMSSNLIRNNAAPNYYEGLANLKGVDVHTASLTFRTITTRGFVSSGNTRMNQLVDGMDNQAPGLNFSVSTIVGLTESDVDNVELLSGASSALYGSGGMNGTLLINSKNPFKYQGFSFNIKQGIMHIDAQQRPAAPYYNWDFRWAKAFNNKIAFKITGELLKGNDWQADDYRNKTQTGILSNVIGGNRGNDPNFNGVNIYGDETSFNMNGFSFYVQDQTRRTIIQNTLGFVPGGVDVVNLLNAYYGAIGNPKYPTNAQRDGFYTFPGFGPLLPLLNNPAIKPAIDNMFPFYNGLKNNYFIKNPATGEAYSVSRSGYEEKYLVDYNTLNVKLNGGIYWKIAPTVELSLNSYFGTGTSVYTGADRYSLRNFKIGQHKLELKSNNFMWRLYTTQENSGESYIAGALGAFLNEAYNRSSVWFPTYIATFSETRRQGQAAQSDITIHNNARAIVDANRLKPGTPQFDAAVKSIRSVPVNAAGGSLFLDRSDMWASETQFNLSDAAKFSDKLEIIMGAAWKQWIMKSNGTIFDDAGAPIKINEEGAFVQLKKKLLKKILTLGLSGRYDKQTNFNGKFTPRFSAVVQVAKENNIRVSYQTAYRFPTNQNQYINLRLGGGSSFLIGCLPYFQSIFKLNSTLPGYTAASVKSYRAGSIADSNRLVQAVYKRVKPESVNSFEVGYKGIINKKILIDAYAYYSVYKDFLISTAVVQSNTGNKYEIYSPFSTSISYTQNSEQDVKSIGWGIGIEYQLVKKFVLYGNVFSDELRDVPAGEVTFFNAPKYRYNIGLRNENVYHNIGFNVVAKWQDNNYYEGTFVTGTLPYFTWVDAQISYRPPKTKSLWRIGGTNIGNAYYRTGFGSPYVGGVYYISYGYNIF
jgi:outer membrane receptor protein involved in Fe transport